MEFATVDTLVGYMYVYLMYISYLTDRLLDGFGIGIEMEMGLDKKAAY